MGKEAEERLVPFPFEYALYRIPVSPARHSRASGNPELEVTFQYRQDHLETVLVLWNEESERTQAVSTTPRRPSHSGQPHHRLLPGIGRAVGGPESPPSPAGEYPSLGRRPAPDPGPDLRQRYLLRTAHRLPVESPGRHRHLLRFHRPPALSAMGRRRGAPGAMADWAGTL